MTAFRHVFRTITCCAAFVTGAVLAAPAVTAPTVIMPDTAFPASVQRLLNRVQSAVVEIRDCPTVTTTPECTPLTQNGSSSGVLISTSGEVLTIYHNIRHATRLVVITADGLEHSATVVGFDELLGLALLRLPEVTTPRVPLATGLPEVGTHVLTLGFTDAWELTPRTGKVKVAAAVSEAPEISASQLQLDVAIHMTGAEGGGAVFDLQGQLVGLLAAVQWSIETGASTYAVPTLSSADLARLRSGVRREVPGLGLSSVAAFWGADRPVSFFETYGLGSLPGLVFTSTWPGGPAQQAGLKQAVPDAYDANHQPTHATGDVIIAIDGQRVTGYASYRKVMRLHLPGDTVMVSVIRDGRPEPLVISVKLSSLSEEPAGP